MVNTAALTDPRMTALLRPRMTPYIRHVPTVKQQAFLLLNCREAMFGGAAGGAKSWALLMAALQFVDLPGYSALLLRRTFADLNKPGALIPLSQEWLAPTDARWSEQQHQWRFPSGATLAFGYLDHERDVYQYQGAAYQFVGFDELTQFTQSMYVYLFSRLRKPSAGPLAGVPLRMRSASNPGGIGHDWVLSRFIHDGRAAGRMFIPARLSDNPHLDAASYIEGLGELDDVTRAQLLDGDWMAQRTDGVVPRAYVLRCKADRELTENQRLPVELGMDVGAGGDMTVIRERRGLQMGRVWRAKTPDTMAAVGLALEAIDETGATAIKIDAIGVGKGCADRLAELRGSRHTTEVHAVNVGRSSFAPERFSKLRDQLWWELGRELTEQGAIDLRGIDLQTEMDLIAPMWTRDSAGRIKIEPKEQTKRRLGRSTDDGDAWLLALYVPPYEQPAGAWLDDEALVTIGPPF